MVSVVEECQWLTRRMPFQVVTQFGVVLRQWMTFSHGVKEKVESIAESLRPDVPVVFRLGVEALAEVRLSERDGNEATAAGQDVAYLKKEKRIKRSRCSG